MCGRIFIQPTSTQNEVLSGLGLGGIELPTFNNLAPTENFPPSMQESKRFRPARPFGAR